MLRRGSRASSARFDTVSIPVYAIIATGIANAKFAQVGAFPQWMFEVRMCELKISAKPRPTRSNCVAKSTTASRMFSAAASLIPTMLIPTRMMTTTIPPMMSHGFVRSGAQKIER